ncbi:hypothetical protein QJU89_08550 [Pasteurella skyensis]|uniref:Uncharacterized protein n=1 Tax=Phocoenobacter skyensis TaxID=97481 RepID=A0AAJ6NB77_9PAST|nr:hypothetical protein [Pasteurella skyensis]MDP8163044.1 hypothetical protein [Pasteurella skyensis]MDP8173576.1 hypothetical protein [Pasteurella skyensis]MDP8176318.1 hypothetical protein [Pasteurella skyensis]MDP8178971.1 hypothetical protein [Pasteurella skyensis]MDP8183741.1 hypothetical protein [Pasteurella skyensis]
MSSTFITILFLIILLCFCIYGNKYILKQRQEKSKNTEPTCEELKQYLNLFINIVAIHTNKTEKELIKNEIIETYLHSNKSKTDSFNNRLATNIIADVLGYRYIAKTKETILLDEYIDIANKLANTQGIILDWKLTFSQYEDTTDMDSITYETYLQFSDHSLDLWGLYFYGDCYTFISHMKNREQLLNIFHKLEFEYVLGGIFCLEISEDNYLN